MKGGEKVFFGFSLMVKVGDGEEKLFELSLNLDEGTTPFNEMMFDKALAQIRSKAISFLSPDTRAKAGA